jgi:hypothetical protein
MVWKHFRVSHMILLILLSHMDVIDHYLLYWVASKIVKLIIFIGNPFDGEWQSLPIPLIINDTDGKNKQKNNKQHVTNFGLSATFYRSNLLVAGGSQRNS